MQGVFNSSVAGTPAANAVGTNGADGVDASSDTGVAVRAISKVGTAVEGISNSGFGIVGGTDTGIAVVGNSLKSGIGVRASSESGPAVNAQSKSGIGVLGASDTSFGVMGECTGYSFGVVGKASNAGVAAFNPNNEHAAYLASDCCAAWFTGDVAVTGALSKGGGGFRIDHPLNPAKKYLSHSFVESSEMKNLYDGLVVLDAKGEAEVELPLWFELLNADCRYQLTAVGGSGPNLHIARELHDNRFTIGGGTPGLRVSWQLAGTRRDAWALAHRIIVEEEKPADEQGYYLHPELHGASEDRHVQRVRHRLPA